MANEQNLIPANKRSKSEARENGKKGGIASGKARRKKADFQKALKLVLSSKVSNENLAVALENLGYEKTNEMAIALNTVQKAVKGDLRAVELIERSTAMMNKDTLDKAEQKERIKALQLENKRKELELQNISDNDNRQVVFLNEDSIKN